MKPQSPMINNNEKGILSILHTYEITTTKKKKIKKTVKTCMLFLDYLKDDLVKNNLSSKALLE